MKNWYVRRIKNSDTRKNRNPRQISFLTGTVGPLIGNFLYSLNTNDRLYLSHIPLQDPGKDKTNSYMLAIRQSVTSFLF